MSREDLSLSEARRIALAAQGFDRPRPNRRVSARDLATSIRRIGLLQIDCVNVMAPAHYQVLFSQLGPYERPILDELVYKGREFTKQWSREASIVPVESSRVAAAGCSLLWYRRRRGSGRLLPHTGAGGASSHW